MTNSHLGPQAAHNGRDARAHRSLAPLAAATIARPATANAAVNFGFHSPYGKHPLRHARGRRRQRQPGRLRGTADRSWLVTAAPAGLLERMHRSGDALTLYKSRARQAFSATSGSPTTQTSGQILNYGETLANGTITCKSEPAGMTCTDVSTGHFFRIARESYQLG